MSSPVTSAAASARLTSGRKTLIGLASLALLLFLCASWTLAYRLMSDPGNSFYTFGYVGDEYYYAQRMQPLVTGTTKLNTLNGMGDTQAISPFFLEDTIRFVLNLSGLDVISFIWIWRWLFPLVAALAFLPLVVTALPNHRRPWTKPLRLGACAAGLACLYLLYDAVTEFPPLQGFIQRIPTNVEYPMSFLMAWAAISYFKQPDYRRAALLALVGVLLIYFRLYAAIPWAMAILVMLALGIRKGELPLKPSLFAASLVIAGALPWLYITWHNGQLSVFQAMLARYFSKIEYSRHKQWALMIAFSQTIAIFAYFTPRWRTYMIGCAVALAALPFVVGLPSVRSELLQFDRYGVFYLVALVSCALLWLGTYEETWRGKGAPRRATTFMAWAVSVALTASVILIARNAVYPLNQYPWGPLKYVQADVKYVPAYLWLKENTPETTVVLVDQGYDWGEMERQGRISSEFSRLQIERDDLFMVVAQRRVAFSYRLFAMIVPDRTFNLSGLLFLGTFGLGKSISPDDYANAMKEITPDYIFWKKTAPIPRGYGEALRPFCRTIHQDDVCEIWEVNKQELLAALPGILTTSPAPKATRPQP